MEPSHVPLHNNADIERAAILTLKHTFPLDLSIPIDIDLVAEKQPMIDAIRLLPDIKNQYMISDNHSYRSTTNRITDSV